MRSNVDIRVRLALIRVRTVCVGTSVDKSFAVLLEIVLPLLLNSLEGEIIADLTFKNLSLRVVNFHVLLNMSF